MYYECQFQQSRSDKLILEQNGKDPRYSGVENWRHALNIDSRTKRLGVAGVTGHVQKI